MKHFTQSIPLDLAEKLKAAGMPIEKEGENTWCPPYATCFDWLMDKGVRIYILKHTTHDVWRPQINNMNIGSYCDSWHEAANAAIEKALTLI